ncbi:hypothetical protein SODALDRAFT_58412 [Sodiomyces alkalinus F11]|uniref:Complex 1 LYR protein domain-containing protein n=1 Tax=Sodiomyces alkalinus (strain CBS 110278 / VKM F-3762 / F11) TaxID=1314773 RepID=A0A3N2PNX4_SODAK|nr:hypothetical protein SODALDRAFT_58412 [Sodiomyces alkalinus F11]ROT36130.1 hypothetical protein SODALDRAFT_58412 [Sodiomyces alkalinus F11]
MIPLSRPIQPLHLYRHLLREASYFPQICRPYLVARIRERFRATRDKLSKVEALGRRRKDNSESLQELTRKSNHISSRAIWQGNRHLKGLRASNLGDVARLRRTLRHAFGRLGKRRRELLATFVQHDAPADSTALEARLDELDGLVEGKGKGKGEGGDAKSKPLGPGTDEKGRPLPPRLQDKWDTPKLLAYVKSQIRHHDVASPAAWSRSHFTNSNPATGTNEENIWGKPLPMKRRRLRIENWWKNAANKIMPPVSKTEWETLAAASRGDLPSDQWRVRPRRPVAQQSQPLAAGGGETETTRQGEKEHTARDWAAYATTPVWLLERPKKKSYWRLTLEKDDGPWSQQENQRSRPPTGRNMRREYVHLWQSTAFVEQNPATQAKKFHWGNPTRVFPAPSSRSWFFETSEESVVQAPARPGRDRARKSQNPKQQDPPTTPV